MLSGQHRVMLTKFTAQLVAKEGFSLTALAARSPY